jgi:hypothetical protein
MEATAATIAPAAQHLRALQIANEVRVARAALKRSIRAGEHDPAEVVLTCPWMAETMSVGELLRSQRRWGRARAQKLLSAAGLRETKTLSALTQRQRIALSDLLSGARGKRVATTSLVGPSACDNPSTAGVDLSR